MDMLSMDCHVQLIPMASSYTQPLKFKDNFLANHLIGYIVPVELYDIIQSIQD